MPAQAEPGPGSRRAPAARGVWVPSRDGASGAGTEPARGRWGARAQPERSGPSPRRGPEEDGEEEAAAGPRQAHDSLYRVHMPSLYSCGSSYGSEASLPAAAHTVSNAPVTEYM